MFPFLDQTSNKIPYFMAFIKLKDYVVVYEFENELPKQDTKALFLFISQLSIPFLNKRAHLTKIIFYLITCKEKLHFSLTITLALSYRYRIAQYMRG